MHAYVCLCVCVCVFTCIHMCHIMGAEDNLQESCNESSSFHLYMGFELMSSGLGTSIFTCWASYWAQDYSWYPGQEDTFSWVLWRGQYVVVAGCIGSFSWVLWREQYFIVAGCIGQFCSIFFTCYVAWSEKAILPAPVWLTSGMVWTSTERFRMSKGKHSYMPFRKLSICVFPLNWACGKLNSNEYRQSSPAALWNIASPNHCRPDEVGLITLPWICSQHMDIAHNINMDSVYPVFSPLERTDFPFLSKMPL